MKLFLGNLSYTATVEDLRTLLHEYGEPSGLVIATDRETGRSRGFGFVEFPTSAQAERACAELHGRTFQERRLVVQVANQQAREIVTNWAEGTDLDISDPMFVGACVRLESLIAAALADARRDSFSSAGWKEMNRQCDALRADNSALIEHITDSDAKLESAWTDIETLRAQLDTAQRETALANPECPVCALLTPPPTRDILCGCPEGAMGEACSHEPPTRETT